MVFWIFWISETFFPNISIDLPHLLQRENHFLSIAVCMRVALLVHCLCLHIHKFSIFIVSSAQKIMYLLPTNSLTRNEERKDRCVFVVIILHLDPPVCVCAPMLLALFHVPLFFASSVRLLFSTFNRVVIFFVCASIGRIALYEGKKVHFSRNICYAKHITMKVTQLFFFSILKRLPNAEMKKEKISDTKTKAARSNSNENILSTS